MTCLPVHYNPEAGERPHHIKINGNDHRVVAHGKVIGSRLGPHFSRYSQDDVSSTLRMSLAMCLMEMGLKTNSLTPRDLAAVSEAVEL